MEKDKYFSCCKKLKKSGIKKCPIFQMEGGKIMMGGNSVVHVLLSQTREGGVARRRVDTREV